jgi:hypothetical protein
MGARNGMENIETSQNKSLTLGIEFEWEIHEGIWLKEQNLCYLEEHHKHWICEIVIRIVDMKVPVRFLSLQHCGMVDKI